MKLILLITFFAFNAIIVHAAPLQQLQVYYGSSLFKYKLSSDQFRATKPITAGSAFAIDYSYQDADSPTSHRFSLFQSSHNFSVPASLSPSSINSRQTKLNYKFVTTSDLFNFGVGYSFYRFEADATTPNTILNSSESHAVDLYLEKNIYDKSDLKFNLFSDLELPFIRKEYQNNTGYNQVSYIVHLGYNLKYVLNDAWSIQQKSEYVIDVASYDGQGNRGTLNAKEVSERFQFMLGAGYDF